VASRRDSEKLIEAGRIQVNGKKIFSPALNVQASDKIEFDGEPIEPPEEPRLWLYHKPIGLVTSARDEKGRETVFDKLPEGLPRVVSVGRLDMNSEGLLLLTNDGGLKRTLELPSTGWTRRYRVRIKGYPREGAFEPLTQGITVDGERFQPMSIQMDRQTGANFWLTIGLKEGKNREIRRAMEFLGFTVNRLIRISYARFSCATSSPARWKRSNAGCSPINWVGRTNPRSCRANPGAQAARHSTLPRLRCQFRPDQKQWL